MYLQNLHTPIHLRDELQTELVLMHYFGLITILSNSKYGSPNFAQRKDSGNLCIFINLRRIKHLLRNDYLNSTFPVSNIILLEHSSSVNLTALKLTTVYRWPLMFLYNYYHLTLHLELTHISVLYKD